MPYYDNSGWSTTTIYAPYIPLYTTQNIVINNTSVEYEYNYETQTLTPKGKHTMPCDCPTCKRDMVLNGTIKEKCACCQKELDALSKFQIMGDKSLVCDDCVATQYVMCPACQKLHKKAETKLATFRDTPNATICPRCFAQYYRECVECHTFFDRHDVMSHGDKISCRPCLDKSFQVCTHCSTIKPQGSMTKYRPNIGRDGKPAPQLVCDPCWNFYGPIGRYESKPNLVFQGRPPHYYGVELECEVESHKKEERGGKAQEVVDLLGDFAIVKEDGSLSVGFEICTQPASLDEHKIRWGKFFDNMPKNLISFNSRNCGLHVHCSKKPLSLLTIAKMVVFVNSETNQQFIETIAGRGSNTYCVISKKKYAHVLQMPQMIGRRDYRYEAINLVNQDTIEFRLFKGTLKRESFFKALEFCDALIHFSSMGTNSISFCKDQQNFMNYVGLRAKDYPHLYAFMCAKFKKQETKLTKQYGFTVPGPRRAPEPTPPPRPPEPTPAPPTPPLATEILGGSITPNTTTPPPVVNPPIVLNPEYDNQI